jgi:ammonium transporter, Amt family
MHPGTMQIFTITCLITFLWLVFGYSLAFSPAQLNGKVNEVYGNAERLWLRGMMTKTSHALAPTIPEAIFCAYQLTFAIITAGLICGSFADRMKYHSMIIFITFWHLIVYCPIAHSNWHPQGWLYRLGVLDYAGGNVVHICSGMAHRNTHTPTPCRLNEHSNIPQLHNIYYES